MDKTTRLQNQWYSFWSAYGEHQFINELGNAYLDEGYVENINEGFAKADKFLRDKINEESWE